MEVFISDKSVISQLFIIMFIPDKSLFYPSKLFYNNMIFIPDVQVEGGTDPDDLEELEDAQSLAKVVWLLNIFHWILCIIHLSYPAQVIKRRMAVDWAAEMWTVNQEARCGNQTETT